MKFGAVFPGQGSQYIGMGKDLYDRFPSVKEKFDKADEILGRKLTDIIFSGTEDELKKTINTQPAIYTMSCAIYDLLSEEGLKPEVVLGHSLGEFSALYAAGVFDFETGLRIVKRRSELMFEVNVGDGAMAAIMSTEEETLHQVLKDVSKEGNVAELSIYNSPVQMVISGNPEAVQNACDQLKELGKSAVVLNTSGPFHSSLLNEAASKFKTELEKIKFNAPLIPVVANVTGLTEDNPEKIKNNIIEQVCKPVYWTQSVEWAVENKELENFIEIGPKTVLKGIIRKINRKLKVTNAENVESFYKTLEAFGVKAEETC